MTSDHHLYLLDLAVLLPFLQIILLYASSFSGLLPVYTGSRQRGALWYYCMSSLLLDIIQLKVLGLHPKHMGDLFFVLELLLVGFYLNRKVFSGTQKSINRIIIFILLVYYLADTLHKAQTRTNLEAGALLHAYFIVILFFAFVKIIQDMEYIHIQQSPFFIFCVGFFIYVSGSCIILLFDHLLGKKYETFASNMWIIFNFLNFLKNILIGYSFTLKNAKT